MTEGELHRLAAEFRQKQHEPCIRDMDLLRDIGRFLVSAGYEDEAYRKQAMVLFDRMAHAMAQAWIGEMAVQFQDFMHEHERNEP